MQVCCLNWLTLGCPTVPPRHACVSGALLSATQQQTLDTLERHVAHFCSAEPLSSQALGRTSEKFNLLLELASALPTLDVADPAASDVSLTRLVADLHAGWDLYSRRPRSRDATPATQPVDPTPVPGKTLGTCKIPAGLTCKEVVADRIKWTLPPSF